MTNTNQQRQMLGAPIVLPLLVRLGGIFVAMAGTVFTEVCAAFFGVMV